MADRGVVLEALIEDLEVEGREYIVGTRLMKGKAVDEVLEQVEEYREVADSRGVKEVEKDGKRHTLCCNRTTRKGIERDELICSSH